MSNTWSSVSFGHTKKRPSLSEGRSFLGQRNGSLSGKHLPRKVAELHGTAAVVQTILALKRTSGFDGERPRSLTESSVEPGTLEPSTPPPSDGDREKGEASVGTPKSRKNEKKKKKDKKEKDKDKDKNKGDKKKGNRFKDLIKKVLDEENGARPAEEFVEFLRSSNLDKDLDELHELCSLIQSSGEAWVAQFANAGGVADLISLLQPPSACKDPFVAEMYCAVLKCLCALVAHPCARDELCSPDNLLHIVLLILQNSPVIVGLASSVMQAVLRLDSGFAIVHKTLEMVSNATGGRSLLYPFLWASSLSGETPAHKISALADIVEIMGHYQDFAERWRLHTDLLRQGLFINIRELYTLESDSAYTTLQSYEFLIVQDHDERCEELRLKTFCSDAPPPNYETFFSVEFRFVENLEPLMLSIEKFTTFADIIEVLNARQAFLTARFSRENFGLFLSVEDKWASPSEALAVYSFEGEVPAEFRLKPWHLEFSTSEGDRQLFGNPVSELTRTEDPHDLVDVVLQGILEVLEADESEEWGLYWVEKDTWLERSWRMCDFDLFDIEQRASLKVMRAPIKVHVQFRGRSLEFTFGPEATALDVAQKVSQDVNIPPDQQHEYGIYENVAKESSDDPTFGLIDESELIIDVRRRQSNRSNFVVSLRIKPLPVRLFPPVPEGEEEGPDPIPFRVFFRRPMGEAHALFCKSLELDPDMYHLYWKTDAGEVKGLFRWSSLKDQSVPAESDLVLMKKAYTDIDDIIDDDEDNNLWDEEIDDTTLRMNKEDDRDVVTCGSLNQLVRLLTNDTKFDSDFVNTFLLTYRSFTTPDKLLKKLFERYDVSDEVMEEAADVIRMRVCVVLKRWVERFNDEKETQLIGELSDFIDGQIDTGPTVVSNVRAALMKVKKDGRIVTRYRYSKTPPPVKLPKSLKSFTLVDVPPIELARQLSIKTFKVFAEVKPFEFFNQAWSKPKYQHLCPNVMKMIEIFNSVSTWVGSAIVLEETLRARAKVMEHFILIAKHLRDLNNYHTLQAVISGFNSSSLLRLKWTRQRLSKRVASTLTELEALTNMEQSFKSYRGALANSEPPLIPYFGVYLGDLTFIDEGNPDMIDGMIHFAKRELVYKLLSQISTYQVKGYNLEVVPELQEFLSDLPMLDEKEMYAASLLREPRNVARSDIL